MTRTWIALILTVGSCGLTGCSENPADKPQSAAPTAGGHRPKDKVEAERAKLNAEDQQLVVAQEWCVISTDERLGSMGRPIKLDIKGKPVFICCKGCKKTAEAEPDKTLARLDELKAKAHSAPSVTP